MQITCSPPVNSGVRVARSLVFCVMYCRSLLVPLSFYSWPLCCLSFDERILVTFYERILVTFDERILVTFDERILVTPLISSNFSC